MELDEGAHSEVLGCSAQEMGSPPSFVKATPFSFCTPDRRRISILKLRNLDLALPCMLQLCEQSDEAGEFGAVS